MPKKSLLVFINPASGRKLADKRFKENLEPKLLSSGLSYEVIRTEFAGHAYDFVKHADLSNYSGIVTVSGDGLVFEVVNGLYNREDWDDVASKIPLGIMPGGTGNALACSMSRQLEQSMDDLGVEGSTNNIAIGNKVGRTKGLDLIEVELKDRTEKVMSFMGVTIGLIADVDIGTECMRCIGYVRSYLMVAWRIIRPMAYKARISYLPLPLDPETGVPLPVKPGSRIELPSFETESHNLPEGWVTEEDKYYMVYAENVPLLDPYTLMAPDSEIDDGIIWLVLVRARMPRPHMIEWLLTADKAGHVGKIGVDLIPVRAFRIEPIYPEGYMTIDGESYPFGPVQGQILSKKANVFVEKETY